MKITREVFPLNTLEEIRIALRKRTIRSAVWKNQAENGAKCQDELFAYIGLMSEDECKAFINSVREAPFIPGLDLMWTEQVLNYFMLGDLPRNMKRSEDRCATFGEYARKNAKADPFHYYTDYARKSVDKQHWNLLPLGGSANYYSPSQVLRLAVAFRSSSELAEYISEKLFIKAADLEDCLSPTVKVPDALPVKPRQRKAHQKKVFLQIPDGAHVSIEVPKPEQAEVPKVTNVPEAAKVSPITEIPRRRRNPVVATAPMFARDRKQMRLTHEQAEQLAAIVKERYNGFGGTCSACQLARDTGVSKKTIAEYISKIRTNQSPSYGGHRPLTMEFLEKVKPQLSIFGGAATQSALAKKYGVSAQTVYRWSRIIRANAAKTTT